MGYQIPLLCNRLSSFLCVFIPDFTCDASVNNQQISTYMPMFSKWFNQVLA